MDYFSVLNVYITITAAIFGFTQYFYSRIDTKDIQLLTKIREASHLSLNTKIPHTIKTAPDGVHFRERFIQLENKFRGHIADLENTKSDIGNDEDRTGDIKSYNKTIIHKNMRSVTPIFSAYLFLLGLSIACVEIKDSTELIYLGYIAQLILFGISIVLFTILVDVFNRVRNANFLRKRWKQEIEKTHNDLLSTIADQNNIRENIKKIFGSQENENTLERETLESKFNKSVSHLSNENIEKLIEMISNMKKPNT